MRRMVLEVRREMIPVGPAGPWEQQPYSQVVWKHDGSTARVFPLTVPHDYVAGIAQAYLDGNAVHLPIFDAAIGSLGISRLDLERLILGRE